MSWTRRRFLTTTSAGGALAGAAFRGRFAWAQGTPITIAHSVSTFVYGQHLVAREKKMFEEEGVELLYKPYMDTFDREIVLRSVKYYKTIFDWDLAIAEKDYQNAMKVFVPVAIDAPVPYARAVELSFLKKAQAKYKS